MLGGQFLGIGQCFCSQGLGRSGHAIKQFLTRQHGQHFAVNGLATDNHIKGRLYAQHSGQSLRCTGTRDEAELHFRQCHLTAWRSHPIVTTQSQLYAAAHGNGVHSRQHGFG